MRSFLAPLVRCNHLGGLVTPTSNFRLDPGFLESNCVKLFSNLSRIFGVESFVTSRAREINDKNKPMAVLVAAPSCCAARNIFLRSYVALVAKDSAGKVLAVSGPGILLAL